MDSKDWILDFGMQILLAHAMKSEAGLIRQHYPKAKTIVKENGQELIHLKSNLHLLRTGIGLELSEMAMVEHVDPDKFDMIIHFGVSGSLSDNLGVLDIVKGVQFSGPVDSDIWICPPEMFGDLIIPESAFFSSPTSITDEKGRVAAKSTGAEAIDMESYSVARFCQVWEIPLLALRCISDRAGDSTPEDFKQNYSLASQTLQKFLLQYILTRFPGCA